MRFTHLLPLAALGAAFVVPDEQILADLAVLEPEHAAHHVEHPKAKPGKRPATYHDCEHSSPRFDGALSPQNPVDFALQHSEALHEADQDDFVDGFDAEAWLEGIDFENLDAYAEEPPHHPPSHHGPPGHGPPGHKKPPHKKPHKRPHSPHHHHGTNKTIYELISASNYTTVLAKLIANDTELVKVLNSTKANFTLFAPIDSAFAKIPEHAHKPSKEFIKKVLLYHVSPGLYPAGRLLFSHTVPTLYNESLLGDKPQRLRARAGLRGISINFYSKVIAANIPATNGIIHGVASIIVPPPKALKILELLPAQFSTLLLGLGKTGLLEDIAEATTVGGTVFAPPNDAFKKLGPRINAFLFSKFGEKYLKALLKYHLVANETLYSNAFYGPSKAELLIRPEEHAGADTVPYVHYDLPTALDGKSLAVDVTRFGPFITIKINGFTRVVVSDGIAKDGVIQVVNNVLIPPKSPHGGAAAAIEHWQGEEMSVEEFKERLGPFLEPEEVNFDL